MTVEEFESEWLSASPTVTAHTSGSTGVPKEMKLLKADMRASAKATNEFFGLDCNSVFVSPLSVDYIAGKMMVVRAMEAGAKTIMLLPSTEPEWEGRASLLAVVPAQVHGALRHAERIDNMLIGGAPLSPQLRREIVESGVKAYESYGMTETCSHVALRRVGESEFQAMPGVSFGTDSRGCLIVRLPHYSIGEVVTNDIVELKNDRSFRWLGRADNVINTGGIKVHPEALEAILSAVISDLGDLYITSRASEKWGEEVVLVLAAEKGKDTVSIDDIRQKLLEAGVDRRHLPKDIIKVAELPRTPNGKLRRQRYS